jgi:hypothetical protein
MLHKNWSFYDGLHVVFRPQNMSAGELQRGMIECFSDFYSYANAFNDALSTVYEAGRALLKKLYAEAPIPSFRGPAIKLVAPAVVRKWVKENRPYLRYLSGY